MQKIVFFLACFLGFCLAAAVHDTQHQFSFSSLISASSCQVSPDSRTDCGYIGSTQDDCEQKGCCWSPVKEANIPWCFHRDANACKGYTASKVTHEKNSVSASLEFKGGCRLHGPDIQKLSLFVEYETDTRIHFKITDAQKNRFEVPESLFPRPGKNEQVTPDSAAYQFELSNDPASFKVVRKFDGEVIFDTSSSGGNSLVNPLIYEEQYLEISTKIPSNANIYGLGEVVHSFRRDDSWTRQTMWARDVPLPKDQNVYGTHPFHMEMRNGKAHGVLLLNSNGMDVLVRPGAITYKVIGGILDFYVFVGPTPADVVHQYYEVIGYPHMIPRWVLGFHHCRYGYKNIWEVKDVVKRYRESGIPLETMWTDIDYMDAYKDFTVDPKNFPEHEMKKMIDELHERKQHYVLILDPAIKAESGYEPYEEGVRKGIFIKKPNGNPLIGKVWPGLTAFPDFLNPETQAYWTKWIKNFMEKIPVDGWWIDMNEPASFCDGDCSNFSGESEEKDQLLLPGDVSITFDPNNPSYKINNAGWEAPLKMKTVSPDALHYNNTLHYDVHNVYGHSESIVTRQSLLEIAPGKRPFVLSRSTFPGTGSHAGHWTGDNWSTWEHLYLSIPAMLNFQLFGIPLVGADICGFIGNVNEELCSRWMQLGAFYPFSRNHNTINAAPQEPYLWKSVTEASKAALNVRYSILPYFYTLFYKAHKFGVTVVRPLLFEFPQDRSTYFYDRQFLVGDGILITPVLEEWARSVNGYFPAGKWYDWYTHSLTVNNPAQAKEGSWIRLNAPLDFIPVHIRGGYMVPTQKPEMTTYASSLNPYELVIALDENMKASGDLFIDDGESLPVDEQNFSLIHFKCEKQENTHSLIASGIFNYSQVTKLSEIYVLGLDRIPKAAFLNGQALTSQQWQFDAFKSKLVFKNMDIQLKEKFSIEWTY